MRMPAVTISESPHGEIFVEFTSDCGRVTGTALRNSGEGETHYDVAKAHRIDESTGPRMVAVPGVPGSFDVVGVVISQFDDGVSVISAHGFEFWIEPDECDEVLQKRMSVSCQINNLELYV